MGAWRPLPPTSVLPHTGGGGVGGGRVPNSQRPPDRQEGSVCKSRPRPASKSEAQPCNTTRRRCGTRARPRAKALIALNQPPSQPSPGPAAQACGRPLRASGPGGGWSPSRGAASPGGAAQGGQTVDARAGTRGRAAGGHAGGDADGGKGRLNFLYSARPAGWHGFCSLLKWRQDENGAAVQAWPGHTPLRARRRGRASGVGIQATTKQWRRYHETSGRVYGPTELHRTTRA